MAFLLNFRLIPWEEIHTWYYKNMVKSLSLQNVIDSIKDTCCCFFAKWNMISNYLLNIHIYKCHSQLWSEKPLLAVKGSRVWRLIASWRAENKWLLRAQPQTSILCPSRLRKQWKRVEKKYKSWTMWSRAMKCCFLDIRWPLQDVVA